MKNIVRYIIFPNIIFGVLGFVTISSRALINLDYCLVGILVPFLGRYIAAILYLILFLLDIIATFAPTYHLKPVIILSIFRELSAFEPTSIALFSVLLAAPLLGMWYLTFRKELKKPQKITLAGRGVLLIVPVFLIIIDVVNGSNGLIQISDATRFSYNITGSALVKAVRDIHKTVTKQKVHPKKLDSKGYATSGLRNELTVGTLEKVNIVLVVVESWGVSSDYKLNQALAEPLTNRKLSSRYQIRSRVVPFHGATVSAELRELHARQASDPADIASVESLPALLASKGYDAIAMHGFMPQFFGRNEWYPKIGFHTSLFVNDIDRIHQTSDRCGSTNFRGICDDIVPSLIKQMLVEEKSATTPKFIYWLTLNSHYPFAATPDHPSHFECSKYELSRIHRDVCNLSSTISTTFEALGNLVADPEIPPTRFIIVGDHSPPFLMRSKEGLYDKQFVPMVELMPKTHKKNI